MELKLLKIDERSGCEEGDVVFVEDPFCEHCGDLEPYSVMISDGGTYWCEMCADANGYLPDDDDPIWQEIKDIECTAKIKFHEKELKRLKK